MLEVRRHNATQKGFRAIPWIQQSTRDASHSWAELLTTCFNESAIRFATPLFYVHMYVLYILMLHNVNEKTKTTEWVTFEVKSMTPTKSTFLPDTYTLYVLQTEWIIETIQLHSCCVCMLLHSVCTYARPPHDNQLDFTPCWFPSTYSLE